MASRPSRSTRRCSRSAPRSKGWTPSRGGLILPRRNCNNGSRVIRRLSWLSAGFASICAAANAADSPDAVATSSANLLDEVVVTARKRVERAQDVPISMSVSTGEAMENRNTFRVQEILRTMPNVATEVLQPRQASIAIRGIGKTPANDGLESSVGIFLDGVYLGRPGMAITDLIDVERIEVLRGPQGTLF